MKRKLSIEKETSDSSLSSNCSHHLSLHQTLSSDPILCAAHERIQLAVQCHSCPASVHDPSLSLSSSSTLSLLPCSCCCDECLISSTCDSTLENVPVTKSKYHNLDQGEQLIHSDQMTSVSLLFQSKVSENDHTG